MNLLALIERFNASQPRTAPWMDQKRLAIAAGVSPSLVTRHIKGTRTLTREIAERYAQVLGATVEEVLDGQAA